MTDAILPAASHFIAGTGVEDTEGVPLDVICPATGARIAGLHMATAAMIDRALASAQEAQTDWAARSGTERGRVLRRAADLIRARNEDLSETRAADPTSAADALEWFGGLAATLSGEHIPLGDGDFVYTRREPLGVCAGLGAWNYPMQIAAWKAAPALACGNAMVFKPSEETPLSALKLAEILIEAGAPPAVAVSVTSPPPSTWFRARARSAGSS